jgi:hypothetical protein
MLDPNPLYLSLYKKVPNQRLGTQRVIAFKR